MEAVDWGGVHLRLARVAKHKLKIVDWDAAVQGALIRIWNWWRNGKPVILDDSWLARVLKQAQIDEVRQNRLRIGRTPIESIAGDEGPREFREGKSSDPAFIAERDEMLLLLSRMLDALPPQFREAIELLGARGLSPKYAAQVLHTHPATASRRAAHGVALLRHHAHNDPRGPQF